MGIGREEEKFQQVDIISDLPGVAAVSRKKPIGVLAPFLFVRCFMNDL